MFGSDNDDSDSLADVTEGTQSRRTRRQDLDCDHCGTPEGSVIYDRDLETAWCRDCFQDPDNHPEEGI